MVINLSKQVIINMFNNFTCQKEYECCNVVIEPSQNRGTLLIGDFNSATDEQILKKYSIKTVITAATGLEHLQIPSSVTHIVYPLQDAKSQNIKAYFDQSFLTIDRKLNQGGVLVHCAAGVSRSATLILAYLMCKNKISFKAAINLLKAKRAGVCPNLGFEMQLKKYQKQIIGQQNQHPKLIKKYASERISEGPQKNNQFKQIKKPQNPSLFQFNPLFHANKKRAETKKNNMRHTGYSRPRQKQMYDVAQTQLFVSGKSANRPSSQARNQMASGRKNPLMGTWGPTLHKSKQFQV